MIQDKRIVWCSTSNLKELLNKAKQSSKIPAGPTPKPWEDANNELVKSNENESEEGSSRNMTR